MSKINLTNEKTQITFGLDNIVIRKYIAGIEGGRALDTTGFDLADINAGHVIIRKEEVVDEKTVVTYAPMPVSEGAYAELPEGYAYAGILTHSMSAKKPAASIMTWGIVNEAVLPYAVADIKEDLAAALPHIEFTKDEED